MTVVPAYGNDYTSAKEVKDAFRAGKDFLIADHFHPEDGRYVNRADLIKSKVRKVNVRYAGLRKIAVIDVT
jgi:hypothetical protein